MARARRQSRRAENLTTRIERRAEQGKPTGAAEARLGRVSGRLADTTSQLQGRIEGREAAGRPTGQATKVLGKAQRALGGVPNFTAVSPATGGAAGTPPAPTNLPAPVGEPATVTSAPTSSVASAATPEAPPAPPTFTEALSNTFGQGNPFTGQAAELGAIAGQLGAPGAQFAPSTLFGNPLETAQARAQNLLEQNLAQTQAGFGAAGLGNSSRAALTRGAAIGEAATNLGDILAQRGLQQRQTDLDRLLSASTQQGGFQQQDVSRQLQAMLGGGQLEQGQQALNQAAQQLALGGLGQLGQQGAGLTGIAAQEQQVPGLGGVLSMLGQFGQSISSGTTGGRTTAGKYI